MLTEEKYLRWDNANTIWKVMYWGHYNYDTAGNMVNRVVSQIVNGVAKMYIDGPFTYSRGYQLRYINRTDPGNAETRAYNLTYDANGNVTHIQRQQGQQPFTDSFYEITEMEFDYDAKNRLVKYRFGGAGSWYEIDYDALGRVRARIDLTPTTTKYYSDGRQLVQQLDSSNNVQFDYLRGPTGLDRQWNETNDTRRFYIKDNLGTVWAIVNPSDLSVKRYNYNAWGEHLDKDDADFPTDTNWMRYIGCRVEAFGKGTTTQRDTICHLDHRHYMPTLAVFLQPHLQVFGAATIGCTHANNKPYIYSHNNPANASDRYGFMTDQECRDCLQDIVNAASWCITNCDLRAEDISDVLTKIRKHFHNVYFDTLYFWHLEMFLECKMIFMSVWTSCLSDPEYNPAQCYAMAQAKSAECITKYLMLLTELLKSAKCVTDIINWRFGVINKVKIYCECACIDIASAYFDWWGKQCNPDPQGAMNAIVDQDYKKLLKLREQTLNYKCNLPPIEPPPSCQPVFFLTTVDAISSLPTGFDVQFIYPGKCTGAPDYSKQLVLRDPLKPPT